MNRRWLLPLMLLPLLAAERSSAASQEAADRSFHPYAGGLPTFPGLRPGLAIGKDNVEPFKELLDEALYGFIKEGWVTIKTATTTPISLHPNYIAMTVNREHDPVLGDKPGPIKGHTGGRPFPQAPESGDARAGEKLAWNYRYGINHGDNARNYPFHWQFRDLETGKIERRILAKFHYLNYKYRFSDPKVPAILPNPSDYFRGVYALFLDPLDIKDTQVLLHSHADEKKRDEGYLYLGFQRRVRRLASGQITDPFMGSDITIEDIEGYNGRIGDMHWTYKGTKDMLVTYYNHTELALSEEFAEPDGYRYHGFGGKGGCFPEVTYQLRKVHILESRPVNSNHPVGRRIHYQDAETGSISRNVIYDRKGTLWKWLNYSRSHPDHHHPKNRGAGVAITDGLTVIDTQVKHCTTYQFKTIVDPKLSPPALFTVQHLRGGR